MFPDIYRLIIFLPKTDTEIDGKFDADTSVRHFDMGTE